MRPACVIFFNGENWKTRILRNSVRVFLILLTLRIRQRQKVVEW